MSRPTRTIALAVVLLSAGLSVACEKETHRAARRAFPEILSRGLSPAGQAAALEEFVRAYPEPKTNPNLVRACLMLADYHSRAGSPDIAASWYERAARASPEDPDLLNALGYHYARNRLNLDRAVFVLEKAARLAEERGYAGKRQGFIKDSLGWAYRMRGDLPLSVALLEEASRLAPGVPVIQEHLADAYHALGERDRAAALYLDLYLKGRGTSAALRETLQAIGREGGPVYARDIDRRIGAGLEEMIAADRRDTEAGGATLVELRAPGMQRLYGSLYRPRARTRPDLRQGGVLLVHPLGSTRAVWAPAARALAEAGWIALAMDLRGHGASVSEALPDSRAFTARLDANLADAERDVRGALDFLARLPAVDPARLGVVGDGVGAFLAARAAGADGVLLEPRAIVLVSPWGRPEVYRDSLSRFDPRGVLVIAGSGEGDVLVTARALAPDGEQGAPSGLTLAGPGDPLESAASSEKTIGAIAAFLERRLATASARGGRR